LLISARESGEELQAPPVSGARGGAPEAKAFLGYSLKSFKGGKKYYLVDQFVV